MEIVQILQSVSVIFACLSIILGVDAWRREYIGKRKIELAEDVLTLFYQARDAIRRIRSPFGHQGEGQSRKPGEYETPEQKESRDSAYAAFERYEKERDVFNKLDVIRYRFMARFGSNTNKPFHEIRSVISEIFTAANRLANYYWPRQGRVQMSGEEFKRHLEEMHKYEGVFWEGSEENDLIKQKVDDAIKTIEGICRPIIEEQSGVGSLLVKKLFKRK
jgi:hypothetical protein